MGASETLKRGFRSPALDSQRAFRSLMSAWARPGETAVLSSVDAPKGWNTAAAAAALTLCDADTPVWLSSSAAIASDWLRFHCGCPLIDPQRPERASFAFCTAEELPPLDAFNIGTAILPEDGATLVVMADGEGGASPRLRLSGPGVDGEVEVADFSAPEDLWRQRDAFARFYPAGLDIVLTRGDRAICVPRTTLVEREG